MFYDDYIRNLITICMIGLGIASVAIMIVYETAMKPVSYTHLILKNVTHVKLNGILCRLYVLFLIYYKIN